MTNTVNRRNFITTSLAACALGTTASYTHALSQPQQPHSAITAILKRRLPNINLDINDAEKYTHDLMQRLSSSPRLQKLSGINKSQPNLHQLEHFVVQDFLANSNTLSVAHFQQKVTLNS